MEWLLALGHALLGVLLLPAARAPEATRRRTIEAISVVGVVLGFALVVAGETGAAGWRTIAFEPRLAAPAGLAAAAAWLVTGALAAQRARPEEATLTGVAATGLVLAGTGRYVVPALIFWVCSSVALAVNGRAGTRWTWSALAASDAAVCSAAIAYVVDEDAWDLAGAPGGLVLGALVAAALLRGAVHLGVTPAATAPLFTGGALLLAGRAGGAEPWAALAVLAAGLAIAAYALVRSRIGPRIVATWVTAVSVAVCFVAPSAAALAGAAAVLVTAVAALWPFTAGRGGVPRALAVSLVPLTAGFGAVAAGAGGAFALATAGADSVSWTIVAALLPVTLGAGVVLGARAARADARGFVPEAVLGTWLLVGGIAGIAVLPQLAGDVAPLGESGGVVVLQLVALGAGAGAGVYARRPGIAVEHAYPATAIADLAVQEPPTRALWVTAALAAATVVATGWLTVSGLRVGFL